MKSIAGSLRLDLAAFRELEAFAQLGTDLDKATQGQLDRGYRMVEVLKQGQFKPLHFADQVMIIYAGTKGYLDKIPRTQVLEWERQFVHFMQEQKPEVRNTLVKERKMTKETEAMLRAAIEAFQPQYKAPGAAATTAKKETNVKEGEPPYRPTA
jgi:F-type H+/Na+-transporting ATPase subunit alpha